MTLVATIEGDPVDGDVLLAGEAGRRRALIADIPASPLHRLLRLAADQFLVRRGAELRTIVAGYHWFTDWGRDTMIALPGIALVTGRHDAARRILQVFAGAVSEGMLPTVFPTEVASTTTRWMQRCGFSSPSITTWPPPGTRSS